MKVTTLLRHRPDQTKRCSVYRTATTGVAGLALLFAFQDRGAAAPILALRWGSQLEVTVLDIGQDLFIPGSGTLHLDKTIGDRQAVAIAATGAPLADIQAAATHGNATVVARLLYQVGVVKKDPSAPSGAPVPVMITSSGSVMAENPTFQDLLGAGLGQGSVYFYLNDVLEGTAGIGSGGPTRTASFSGSIAVPINEGGSVDVKIIALGMVDNNGEVQAVIDPFFQIDPQATFVFNGVPTNFSDEYQLAYPDGFVTIPEPLSALLLGAGLVGLGMVRNVLCWKKKARFSRILSAMLVIASSGAIGINRAKASYIEQAAVVTQQLLGSGTQVTLQGRADRVSDCPDAVFFCSPQAGELPLKGTGTITRDISAFFGGPDVTSAAASVGRFGSVGISADDPPNGYPASYFSSRTVAGVGVYSDEFFNSGDVPLRAILHGIIEGGMLRSAGTQNSSISYIYALLVQKSVPGGELKPEPEFAYTSKGVLTSDTEGKVTFEVSSPDDIEVMRKEDNTPMGLPGINPVSVGNGFFFDDPNFPNFNPTQRRFVDVTATLDAASGIVTIPLSFQTFDLGVLQPNSEMFLTYYFYLTLDHFLTGGIAGGELDAQFSDPFHLSTNSALGTITFEPVSSAIPEPSTLLLLGSGFVLVGAARRRKSRM